MRREAQEERDEKERQRLHMAEYTRLNRLWLENPEMAKARHPLAYVGYPPYKGKEYTYDEKMPICELCLAQFVRKSCLSKHVARVHKFMCPLCPDDPTVWPSELNLHDHFTTHTLKERAKLLEGRYPCGVGKCEAVFYTKHARTMHHKLRGTFTCPKAFYCQKCSGSYTTKKGLNEHISRDHEKKRPAYKACDVCNRMFVFQSGVDNHKKRSHEHCEFCDLWFRSEDSFNTHNLQTHRFCPECKVWHKTLEFSAWRECPASRK